LGAIGLPVFAGGKAGLAVFWGPTGGFLFGYLLAVVAVGFIMGRNKGSLGKGSLVRLLLALVAGNVLLYLCGVPWLKAVTYLSWPAALGAGLAPFLPGAMIKIAAAFALGRALLPRFRPLGDERCLS
jgi:biotin transport system substrate-specific component